MLEQWSTYNVITTGQNKLNLVVCSGLKITPEERELILHAFN